MMLPFALLGLLLQAAPTPTVPVADDVVVTGERLRRLKISTKTDHMTGITRCVVKHASGDALLDTRMCEALLACTPKVRTSREMETCMQPSVDSYSQEVMARRGAAGSPPKHGSGL